jgi:PAS domain S-box-containing protein
MHGAPAPAGRRSSAAVETGSPRTARLALRAGEGSKPRAPHSYLPLAGTVFLFLLLLLSLHLAARLRSTLESQLSGRLRVSAELVADALSAGEGVDLNPGGALLTRLEEIRRATSVSEIWLYDTEGRLLGGATSGDAVPAVPSRVRLQGSGAAAVAADPRLREPERDAAGGLTLLVPLARSSGAGALLARLDRESQGGLGTIDFLFGMARAMAGAVIAAGVLILFRWLTTGPVLTAAPPPAPASSDVDFVLGTVREVMSTLKDSETEYRDRMTAAEADAEHWRQTNDLILESLTSGLVAFDSAGYITMFNHAAEGILGVPARGALGRTVSEVLGADDPLARLAGDLERRGRPASRAEMARTDARGETRWLGVSSSILRRGDGSDAGGILLFSDLTETKRLRDQMELKDRLSAVGEMAAGIAHEVKNSIHSIMGYANLLREDFAGEESMAASGILTEVRSLEAMVKGVLEFSRPSTLVKTRASVNDVVRHAAAAVGETAGRAGVAIRVDAAEDLPPVEIDVEVMRRAFLNLALNAVEAMEDGGTLTISTRPAEATGEGVRVVFRDTGPGIPESERASIFTPFYTTKRDGSGLGLALVHKTITDHGGRLTLHSRVGVGTEFVIQLPPEADA